MRVPVASEQLRGKLLWVAINKGTFNDERKRGHLSKGIKTHVRHLTPEKRQSPGMKMGTYENGKWPFVDGNGGTHHILIGAFIRGEKGHLWKGDWSLIRKEKGHVSLLKGKCSVVKRVTYRIWIGALTRYDKGVGLLMRMKRDTYHRWKGESMRRGRSPFLRGTNYKEKGHLLERKKYVYRISKEKGALLTKRGHLSK